MTLYTVDVLHCFIIMPFPFDLYEGSLKLNLKESCGFPYMQQGFGMTRMSFNLYAILFNHCCNAKGAPTVILSHSCL